MSKLGTSWASCFFIIQILARTPGFIKSLKDTGRDFLHDDGSSMTGVLYWILRNILDAEQKKLSKNYGGTEPLVKNRDVKCFMDAIFKLDTSFHKDLQNDCHSFLISLLEIIKRDNKMFNKNPVAIFEGRLQNEYQYTTCDHKEESEEQLFLSLLVPTFDHDEKPRSVQEAVTSLLQDEVFGYDTLKCNTCKEKHEDTIPTKRTRITQPPDILILQLARFKEVKLEPESRMNKLVKEDSCVSFEETLILETTRKLQYKLFGVIIHLGNLEEGHYITYVRSADESHDWLLCDGDDVSHCSKEVVFDWTKTCAYILFYHKEG